MVWEWTLKVPCLLPLRAVCLKTVVKRRQTALAFSDMVQGAQKGPCLAGDSLQILLFLSDSNLLRESLLLLFKAIVLQFIT